jgi:hypothetical protein
MKIIDSYVADHLHLKTDADSMAERYQFMVYPLCPTTAINVQKRLLKGSTVCVFSGSWRLHLDATYLELKQYKHCNLRFHPNTLFVDNDHSELFALTLQRLAPTNIAVIHNDWWTCHYPLEHLLHMLDRFLPYVEKQHGQVVCTLPLMHLNFNRLKYSYAIIADQTHSEVIDNDMIIMRK